MIVARDQVAGLLSRRADLAPLGRPRALAGGGAMGGRVTGGGDRGARDAADDDLALLEAWRGGSRAAGRALVERHYATVYRFFFGKVDPATGEDLTQATFEVLARRRDGYRGEGTVRAYLLGIARYKVIEWVRSRPRRERPFDPGEESGLPAEGGASLASVLGDRQREQLVAQALRSLSLDDQVLLELKEHEGLTIRELAVVLGAPEGTIASRSARARQRLREAVERLIADPAEREASVHGLDSAMRSIAAQVEAHLRGRNDRAQ